MTLRVAIVHYHLNLGGVTKVIESAVASLTDSNIDVVVLSGEPYTGDKLDNVVVVEGLGYSINDSSNLTSKELKKRLIEGVCRGLGGLPDVWHVHNHSLGKNAKLLGAIIELIDEGHRFLFQIHDFAEDGRSANYKILLNEKYQNQKKYTELLYPVGQQCHYALLNSRDYKFLLDSGMDSNRLHLLHNPVVIPADSFHQSNKKIELRKFKRYFFYPVRGIRRKNLGEILLLSIFAKEGDCFVVSLEPENPVWKPVYDHWVKLANELSLPVIFNAVNDYDYSFSDWINNAYAIVTTSIAEGFGMAFLEPWLFSKPLVGRNITDITVDFEEASIDLSSLYSEIPIPLNFFEKNLLLNTFTKKIGAHFDAYNMNITDAELQHATHYFFNEGKVDFGRLDEELQEIVIRKLCSDTSLSNNLAINLYAKIPSMEIIRKNSTNLKNNFGNKNYGKKLKQIYIQIAAEEIGEISFLNANTVLNKFLNPAHINLLRI